MQIILDKNEFNKYEQYKRECKKYEEEIEELRKSLRNILVVEHTDDFRITNVEINNDELLELFDKYIGSTFGIKEFID